MKFSCFSPFVRLNKIGRCFKQVLHQAVMTTTPLIHEKAHRFRVRGAIFAQQLFVYNEALPYFAYDCNKLVYRCKVNFLWALIKNKGITCEVVYLFIENLM